MIPYREEPNRLNTLIIYAAAFVESRTPSQLTRPYILGVNSPNFPYLSLEPSKIPIPKTQLYLLYHALLTTAFCTEVLVIVPTSGLADSLHQVGFSAYNTQTCFTSVRELDLTPKVLVGPPIFELTKDISDGSHGLLSLLTPREIPAALQTIAEDILAEKKASRPNLSAFLH